MRFSRKILYFFWIPIGILVVCFYGFLYWFHTRPLLSWQTYTFSTLDRPTLGKANAPVTLIEFGDFACAACKHWHDDVLPVLKEKYINTGKVDLYFFNEPVINSGSVLAAEAAEAIYHQKASVFWRYSDVMFSAQQPEWKAWVTPIFLDKLISSQFSTLSRTKFDRALSDHLYIQNVLSDQHEGENAFVNSTPTFFLNGHRFNGRVSRTADFLSAIDTLLKPKNS